MKKIYTGRVQKQEFALQNIPVRTEAGTQIRRSFLGHFPTETFAKRPYISDPYSVPKKVSEANLRGDLVKLFDRETGEAITRLNAPAILGLWEGHAVTRDCPAGVYITEAQARAIGVDMSEIEESNRDRAKAAEDNAERWAREERILARAEDY